MEFGAHGIKFAGKRVVAEVLGRTRRPSRAAGQVLREHGADLFIEVGAGTSATPRQLGLDEIESGLGNSTRVRDDVIFVLESMT